MPEIADYHFDGSLHDDPNRKLDSFVTKLGKRKISGLVLTLVLAIMLPVTLVAVQMQQNFRQRAATMPVTSPVITANPGPVKQTWRTNYVSLETDEFILTLNGTKYYGNTSISVNSNPPVSSLPAKTTLETMWMENGVEMRVYFYFDLNTSNIWTLNEVRTYNGQNPGDWISYNPVDSNGKPIQYSVSETYTSPELILKTTTITPTAYLSFKNLRLQAFRDGEPTSTPQLTPSLTPTRVPTSTPRLTSTPTPWWKPTATATPRPTATPTVVVGSVTSGKISVSPTAAKVTVRAGYYTGAKAFTVKNISGKPSFWTSASIQFTDPNARYITISGALWITTQGAPIEIKAMSSGAIPGIYNGTVTIKNGAGGELKLPIQVTVTK